MNDYVTKLIKKYGELCTMEITGYYKYQFIIKAKTSKGYLIELYTGGDAVNIYKYDPLDTSWEEHDCAIISSVQILKHPS